MRIISSKYKKRSSVLFKRKKKNECLRICECVYVVQVTRMHKCIHAPHTRRIKKTEISFYSRTTGSMIMTIAIRVILLLTPFGLFFIVYLEMAIRSQFLISPTFLPR